MFVKRELTLYMTITCLSTLLACGTGRETPGEPVIRVAVSVLPQDYFLERVGGEHVAITVVVPPGASPATYEPSPSDMRSMSDAQIWFTVGVAFEDPWLPRFTESNPELRVVSTLEGIRRRPIGRYSVEDLAEGGMSDQDEHHHESDSPDPHVWLSPELVRSQAGVMARELAGMDPERADFYYENLRNFQLEIDSLQLRIHSLLDTLSSRSFMVFHPAWGYFADEFDLVQVPVESSGSEPSPGEMARLVDFAMENGIETVFVSPQFSTSSARAIAAEIQGEVQVLDPLAPDWPENLIRVAELLAGGGGHDH
jgi:zinc transport system substrate-binding protein